MNIAVVGGGLAGLAVALGCEESGHHVTLFEASSELGGRMKTLRVDNHTLDAGFHVLHTAYSAVKRWIDVDALQTAEIHEKCTNLILHFYFNVINGVDVFSLFSNEGSDEPAVSDSKNEKRSHRNNVKKV